MAAVGALDKDQDNEAALSKKHERASVPRDGHLGERWLQVGNGAARPVSATADYEESAVKVSASAGPHASPSSAPAQYAHGCTEPCGRKAAGYCPQKRRTNPELTVTQVARRPTRGRSPRTAR